VRHRILQQLVLRSEGVERHRAVGQQVLSPFAREPHGVRKNAERIRLREILDAIDALPFYERIDQALGFALETGAQLFHRRPRKHA